MAANARRQRQTYAKCGPRMQQSGCDPMPRRSSNFITKWQRIGPKQRLNWVWRLLWAHAGNPAINRPAWRGAIRAAPCGSAPLPENACGLNFAAKPPS